MKHIGNMVFIGLSSTLKQDKTEYLSLLNHDRLGDAIKNTGVNPHEYLELFGSVDGEKRFMNGLNLNDLPWRNN